MKIILKIISIALISLVIPAIAFAAILGVQQGGTGAQTLTGCLQGNGVSAITGSGVPCGSGGGGSGGGTWASTTSQVPGHVLNYSDANNPSTDIVIIGGTSTSTAKFILDPNSLIGYISGFLGIGTKSPNYNLEVNGTASTSQFSGAGLSTCNSGSFLQWVSGLFSCSAGNSGTITNVTAGTGLTGGGSLGSVTLNLATPVSIANGGTNAITAPLAGDNIGVQSTTTGNSYLNYQTIKPQFVGQLLDDTAFGTNFLFGAGVSSATGKFLNQFAIPAGLVFTGSPDLPGQNDEQQGLNAMTFYLNGNYADRMAQGDTIITGENDSASAFNSGMSYCNTISRVINGSSTALTNNSSCFTQVPSNREAGIWPGETGLINNTYTNDNRGVLIGGPYVGQFGDGGNYPIADFDMVNDQFRLPFDQQYVFDVPDKVYVFTVSGISATPSNAVYKDANSVQWSTDANTVSGGAGTLTMTGTSTPPASGTLTLVELGQGGTGDATVSYSSAVLGSTGTWIDSFKDNLHTGAITMGTTTIATTTITSSLTSTSNSTSTFSKGINLSAGCFAISGSCISPTGGGGSGTVTAINAGTNVTISEGSPCTVSCTINASGSGGGTPGGASSTIQYNANGAFGGTPLITTDGTAMDFGNRSYLTYNGGSPLLVSSSSLETTMIGGAGPATVPSFFTTYSENGSLGIGFDALLTSTSSRDNMAIGPGAMQFYNFSKATAAQQASNGFNVAVGVNAYKGAANPGQGTQNTAIGYGTLGSAGTGATTASKDIAIGAQSIQSITTGTGDIAIGVGNDSFGNTLTTGTENTSVGDDQQFIGSVQPNDEFMVGALATDGCNNCGVLGAGSGTGAEVNVGIGTTTPGAQLSIERDSSAITKNNYVDIVHTNGSNLATTSIFDISPNYNVGIGTSSPYSMLSVAGQVVAQNFVATSTSNLTGTSTFAGNVMIGSSLFNGQLEDGGFFGSPTLFQASNNVNDLANAIVVGNTNPGIYAGSCMSYANDRSSNLTVLGGENYFAGTCFSSGEFNNAIFPGLPPNSLGTLVTDGAIVDAATSANAASSTFIWALGPGFSQGNYDMVLKNVSFDNVTNLANGGLGIGSSTPDARLSLNASTTATFPFIDVNTNTNGVQNASILKLLNNGNFGIGSSTPGTLLSIGNTGANAINLSPTATSTFGSGLNLTTGCYAIAGTCIGGSGGTGSGTVGSGTAGQDAWYASNGTAVSGTSTIFISTPAGLVGINNTSPLASLDVQDTNGATNIQNWRNVNGNIEMSVTAGGVIANNANISAGTSIGAGTFIKAATQMLTTANNTAAAPSYTNAGLAPSNTGMYFPANTTLGFSQAGIQAGVFGLNGMFGLGTSTPAAILSISATSTTDLRPLFMVATSTGTASTTVDEIDRFGNHLTGGTPPTLSSCGTSPSFIGPANNNAMIVQVGSVSATGCTITFANNGYVNTPEVNITNESMSVVNAMTYSVTPTVITISQTGLTGDILNISVTGTQ